MAKAETQSITCGPAPPTTTYPALYHMHLQKTGGVSLNTIRLYAYPRRDRFPGWRLEHLVGWTPDRVASYRLYVGHFGAALLDLLPAQTVTITVLREPVERMLSHLRFRFQATRRLHTLPADDIERCHALLRRDWHAYLDHPASQGEDNMLTRQAGVRFPLRACLGEWRAHEGKQLAAAVDDLRHRSDLRTALASAQAILRDMAVVGLTKEFDTTVALMCDMLGVAPPPAPMLNRAPGRAKHDGFSHRTSGFFPPDVVERAVAMCVSTKSWWRMGRSCLPNR